MPRDATGTFTPLHNFTMEIAAGQKTIRADYMDAQFADIAAAIASDSTTAPRNSGLVRRNASGKIFGDILGNAETASALEDGVVMQVDQGGTGVTTTAALASNVGAILLPLRIANDLSDLHSVATARTNLGLKTGALLDAGTAEGQLVQLLAGGKLPAVSGENLTNLPAAVSVPTGSIILHGSETVPTGYLECNGAAVSRTTYSALFSAIGVAHGYGDNSTTFNLPDARGRFPRGWDHGASRDPDKASRTAAATGGASGDHVGSVQAEAFKAHTHDITTGSGSGAAAAGGSGVGPTTSTSAGGNETRPVNIGLMFCIKY